jgi:hypothetical protein
MSNRRDSLWLRSFPPAWRDRYGQELAALIAQLNEDESATWQVGRDLVRAGACERLRGWGFGRDLSPQRQAKSGTLLVLVAWVMFAVAGIAVQRFSEHWQQFTPMSAHEPAADAFQALLVAALVGSVLVVTGGAFALSRVLTFLRRGGWTEIRFPVLRAAFTSLIAIAVTAGLVVWAHRLNGLQRNGRDPLYGLAFALGGLLVIACLSAWTAVVVAIARRIELPAIVLKVEAVLALGVSLTMLAMSVATILWWATIATRAPWALHELPVGTAASGLVPQLLAAIALMSAATVLAGMGASNALRGVRRVASHP